jgi:hypothetical protein
MTEILSVHELIKNERYERKSYPSKEEELSTSTLFIGKTLIDEIIGMKMNLSTFLTKNTLYITLKDDIQFIPDFFFSNCIHVISVYMNENIIDINKNAFQGCSSLKHMTIYAHKVKRFAFKDCVSLTLVIYTSPMTTFVHSSAFDNCVMLNTK